MKIVELILHKYKRFVLTKPETFIYRPNKKIQIILGTNGSGKSSLLSELNPLPANKSDFLPGGYKSITILHNGKEYVLKSDFDKSTRHSFVVDGEELNPSGTTAIQKTLVDQHFDINKDVYQLMIGSVTLSNMSLSERKRWFTELLNTNYDYPLSIYDKLRERKRDIDGAIKLHNNRLIKERANQISADELNILQNDISLLKKHLEYLYGIKRNTTPIDVDNYLNNNNALIMKHSTEVIKISSMLYEHNDSNKDTIDRKLQELDTELTTYQKQNNTLQQQIHTLQNKISKISNTPSNSELDKELSELKDELITLEKQLQVVKELDTDKIPEIVSAYNTVHTRLTELFTTLPVDENNIYNKETVLKHKERLSQIRNKLEILQKEIDTTTHKLKEMEHLLKTKETECPSCHYKWIPGYNEDRHKMLSELLEKYNKEYQVLDKEHTELEKYLEEVNDRLQIMGEIKNIFIHWPVLTPILDILRNKHNLSKGDSSIITTLDMIYRDMEIWDKIYSLSKRINEIHTLQKQQQSVSDIERKLLTDQLKELESTWVVVKENIRRLSSLKNEYTRLRSLLDQLESHYNALENALNDRKDKYDVAMNMVLNHAIDTEIQYLSKLISSKEKILNETMLHTSIVKDLESQLENMTKRSKVLGVMIEGLCPKKGLIGETVLPRINSVIQSINEKIQQVWTYPIEIIEYIPDENGVNIDYRLSVRVNDTTVIDDIKNCSTAMKEIIDLAFRLVVIGYKQLDIPLYLDEFGKSMDSLHRTKIYQLIAQSAEYSPYSQVYIVSHYESAYGSIHNADFVVLVPDNVDIPENISVNDVVKFE